MKWMQKFSMAVFAAMSLYAQQTVPFNLVGPIQTFTLDSPSDPLSGAKMKVNGITVTIPRNTILFFPARLLTPNDVFKFKPYDHPHAVAADPVFPNSGLALNDPPAVRPLAAFEAAITGNIVSVAGVPTYVAGLVHISQQSLNTSDGYILDIDYVKGELIVGPEAGTNLNDPPVTRVRLNDPPLSVPEPRAGLGRFGKGGSFDERFTVDQDNATIRSATGFPMCIPRTNPATTDDADCPKKNRPPDGVGFLQRFTMGAIDAMQGIAIVPGVSPAPPHPECDARKQAPFVKGDRITFSGTLALDKSVTPPVTYVSAHTITAWLGIYTEPRKNPAYLSLEVSLIGTGGIPFAAAQETGPGRAILGGTFTTRLRIEALATDPTRAVEIFALDYTSSGAGPIIQRSMALAAGSKTRPKNGPVGKLTMPPSSKPPFGRLRLNVDRANYLPPPREILIRYALQTGETQPQVAGQNPTIANGLWFGQYSAPVNEFLFPENLVYGERPIPNNFENFCFLFTGSGPLTTLGRTAGPLVGQLTPWPNSGHNTPQATCP
ncbi:MAG: hypothetical protein ACR2I2_10075 [Bryobacteraceae bacterium]